MERRRFVRLLGGALAGGVFVPRFERWFRPLIAVPRLKWGGEGVYWDVRVEPGDHGTLLISDTDIQAALRRIYVRFREESFPVMTPLLANVRGVSADDYVFRANPPRRRDFFKGLIGGGGRCRSLAWGG